jgi:polysaccharide biosynthesis protein PslH
LPRSKILFISYSGPLPLTDGKRQRTHALLKALEEQYVIDFLVISNDHDYRLAVSEYKSTSVKFFTCKEGNNSWRKSFRKKLGLLFTRDSDVSAYISRLTAANSYSFVFSRYIYPVVHIPPGPRVICDIDDDLAEILSSRIGSSLSFFKRMRLKQISWVNRIAYSRLLKRLHLALFVKEENRSIRSAVIRNLPFQLLLGAPTVFQPCSQSRLLYVGKLSYAPNLQGIVWFLENVWGGLRAAIPSVRLTIVSNTNVERDSFHNLLRQHDGIELLINVKDLREVYLRHAVVLAPVFEGGGSNIKVAEALLMGRPVVTTSFGSRGFGDFGDFIFSYNTAAEFLKGVIALVESGGLEKLQQRIHDRAAANYSFEAWKNNLISTLVAAEQG